MNMKVVFLYNGTALRIVYVNNMNATDNYLDNIIFLFINISVINVVLIQKNYSNQK